jgi:hypothetical protein
MIVSRPAIVNQHAHPCDRRSELNFGTNVGVNACRSQSFPAPWSAPSGSWTT